MEQSLKYLKKDGIAVFLAPVSLLTSKQSDLLKAWLKDYADVIAVITLPESIFGNAANAKSIFVLKKQAEHTPETFVYPLADLQSREVLTDFIDKFKKWNVENMIF
jgi:site-specific DNA-methyltransferase (adenine-specific)